MSLLRSLGLSPVLDYSHIIVYSQKVEGRRNGYLPTDAVSLEGSSSRPFPFFLRNRTNSFKWSDCSGFENTPSAPAAINAFTSSSITLPTSINGYQNNTYILEQWVLDSAHLLARRWDDQILFPAKPWWQLIHPDIRPDIEARIVWIPPGKGIVSQADDTRTHHIRHIGVHKYDVVGFILNPSFNGF